MQSNSKNQSPSVTAYTHLSHHLSNISAWYQPLTLDEALACLAQCHDQLRIKPLAGGTDIFAGTLPAAALMDLSKVEALGRLGPCQLIGTQHDGSYTRIGALVTWTELIGALSGDAQFSGLVAAAREIGAGQIQNSGTIVGNVCNASPAADGTVCLMALDCLVEIESVKGRRYLTLPQFVLGARRVDLSPQELVTGLLIPRLATSQACGSEFVKLGSRTSLLISIVMVAAQIVIDKVSNTVVSARVVVGSCSAQAASVPALEVCLLGKQADDLLEFLPSLPWSTELNLALKPMDDIRASAAYRLHAASVLTRRVVQTALMRAIQEAKGQSASAR